MVQTKPSFRLALVTGASSGIGEALCHLLAHQGINLLITGRNASQLNQIADELRLLVNVVIFTADLSSNRERGYLIEKIHELSPDLVINNAGFGLYGPALTYSTEEQMEILHLNMEAVIAISMEAARTLISNHQQGVILNVSSAAAFQPMPNFAIYAASKTFVNSFSEAFDEETKPFGVRILASCPGRVATKFQLRASGGQIELDETSRNVMSANFAANEIWKQIQEKKTIHIFNWKYRMTAFLTRYLIPRFVSNAVIRKRISEEFHQREFIKVHQK